MQSNQSHKGLGCEERVSTTSFDNPKQKHKAKILQKTHQRYHANDKTVDIFGENSDDE